MEWSNGNLSSEIYRLRIFENKALRRIVGSKQEDVKGGRGTSRYELCTSYFSLDSTGSTEKALER
jgi:hypothetical protein